MGFRARKSIKIAPGVRMNFSKSGVGYSIGGRHARVTKRADGRTQFSTSLPGTGLGYVSKAQGRSHRKPSSVRPAPPKAKPIKPGVLAPKAEKQLYAALQAGDLQAMEAVLQADARFALPAASIATVLHLATGNSSRAKQLAEWVFNTGEEPATHPFVAKYVAFGFAIDVVPGVTAELGLGRSGVGLVLAELRQHDGDVDGAIDVVEQLEPTTYAALSIAELYCEAGRYKDVIELTDGLTNIDDSSALLLIFRGAAFRELGHLDAANESFKEALKSKKRDATVRHRGLYERAQTYEAMGKLAMARKDYERILAEDSTYEGVRSALEQVEG